MSAKQHRVWVEAEDGPKPSADEMAAVRFTVPNVRRAVPRPRLYQRLDSVRTTTPVILLSAPAGSGKTSLLSSWLSRFDGKRAAWATLRADDDDERVFWRTVATTLARVSTSPRRRDLDALAAEQGSNAEESPLRLARLVNENQQPFLLVLDNLHEISSAGIHAGLLQLISQLPETLRVVVATRHDPPWPLHRLRVEGRVEVLRASDLAFDPAESAAMFKQVAVTVTDDQLDRLLDRTEGWAAGLQLAALGIASASDPAQFIAEFSGDDHSVADYLMREVFDRLPPDWQEFLLRVCVVDEICGDLANALTDAGDGRERLARLAEANMFVHSLGHGSQWYRLHHLILDFLNGRLTDLRLRGELHRRAADWFRSRDMPWLALRHAVASHHWELADDLIAEHVLTFATLRIPGDLEALLVPLPPEVILVHPGLAIGIAAARTMRGDPTNVEVLLESVRASLPQLTGQRRRRFEVLLDAIDIGQSRARGDLDRSLAACRRVPTDPTVLAGMGLASWDVLRTIALANMGTSEFWTGDLGAAREHLSLAADARTPSGMLIPRLNAQAHLALLDWLCGDLGLATDGARETVRQFSRAGLPLAAQCVCAYLALAGVAIDRDEAASVDRWLTLAADAAVEPHAIVGVALLGARRDLAEGRFERGVARIRAARDRVLDTHTPQALTQRALLAEADLLRRAGDGVQARLVARNITSPGHWLAVSLRVQLALDAGESPTDAPRSWPAPENPREAVEQHIVRVRCALASGARDSALTLLEQALITAAPLTMRSAFLQEASLVAPLLTSRIESGTGEPEFAIDLTNRMTRSRRPEPNHASMLTVPLTDRESNMLRYLASALSNSEIAHATYVSVNTVKTHQRMIYRKLAVSGRRAAVARARELGLV
jgi:LuxR family maltose regulon positive regulatory protein